MNTNTSETTFLGGFTTLYLKQKSDIWDGCSVARQNLSGSQLKDKKKKRKKKKK